MKKKVLKYNQLPAKLPLYPSIATWLLLDRLNMNLLIWGIVGSFFALLWVTAIVALFKQEQVELKELQD